MIEIVLRNVRAEIIPNPISYIDRIFGPDAGPPPVASPVNRDMQQQQQHHFDMVQCAKPSQAILNAEQLKRLHEFVLEGRQVHGRGNFPTLEVTLRSLVNVLLERLQQAGVAVTDVRMNGGCASHIISKAEVPYNDVDLIFTADLSKPRNFDVIKECVLASLLEFLPDGISRAKISLTAMKDAYVRKMVKVSDEDLWSLISLNNETGRSLELKFVHRMRRQFEFSVDSFQIYLTNLLNADNDQAICASTAPSPNHHQQQQQPQQGGQKEAPIQVLCESVFGDFQMAYYHLNNRLIDTKQPELIRGGGLLKYCQLLAQDYQPTSPAKRWRQTERYMCSRFFIDFPTTLDQQRKLQTYLDNHFRDDWKAKYDFLIMLYRVVDESTVCLMNHDLRMTLSTIENFMYQVSMSQFVQPAAMLSISGAGPPPPPTGGDAVAEPGAPGAAPSSAAGNHQPKPTLLYVPKNASYWVSVM